MSRLLKWCGGILAIDILFNSCVYHRVTHMNDEELEWVTNRHEGEIMFFKSQTGILDTVTIKEITIHNSLDPINWGYLNTSNKDYIASAEVRWVYDIPLNTTSLQIDGMIMNDIMFFENEKSDSSVIKSYSWSKKYGLVQYSFQDGTIFSRVAKE